MGTSKNSPAEPPYTANNPDAVQQQGETTNASDARVGSSHHLAAFYGDVKPKPVAFLKAVRTAKLYRFPTAEVQEALQQLPNADPTLSRTMALVGKGPDAVREWVIEATKLSLSRYMPSAVEEENVSAKNLLERIVDACAHEISSKDKVRKLRAENLLRLALHWLFEKRNLEPLGAALAISRAKRNHKVPSPQSLANEGAQLLQRMKLNQLIEVSVIARLGEIAATQAFRERDEANMMRTVLRAKVSELEEQLLTANEKIEQLAKAKEVLTSEISAVRSALKSEQELRALDRTSTSGRSSAFLEDRVLPLMTDAHDALDFTPPHVEAARQRIEMAITTIKRQVEQRNE